MYIHAVWFYYMFLMIFFLGVPGTLLDSTILITSDSNQPFKGTEIFCHEIVNNELQKNDGVQWKR